MTISNSLPFQEVIRAGVFLLIVIGVIGMLRFVLRLAWKIVRTVVSIALALAILYLVLHFLGLA